MASSPQDLFDNLTGKDLEDLEELCDEPLGAIFDAFIKEEYRARHIRAIVFLTKREAEPELDWESFEYTLDELGELFAPSP